MTMPFDPRTVGPRIRMMLPELTASETRITEILLRKDGDAAALLKAIAEEAETSEAIVVKTAKRLGFSGYKELRAALQAYQDSALRRLASRAEARRHGRDDRSEGVSHVVSGAGGDALDPRHGRVPARCGFDPPRQATRLLWTRRIGADRARPLAQVPQVRDPDLGFRRHAYDGDVRLVAARRRRRRRFLAFRPDVGRARVGSDRPVKPGEHHRITNYSSSPLAELCDVVLCSTARAPI